MKQKFFLFFFIFLFILNCSEITVDEEDDTDRGRSGFRDRDRGGDDNSTDIEACEEDNYTIFTYGDCDPLEKVTDPVASFSNRPSTNTTAGGSKAVDIVFFLDTSRSMNFYLHSGFEQRFKNFIPIISNRDWRLLFTNTSYSEKDGFFSSKFSSAWNGKAMKLESKENILNQRYLDSSTANYSDVFLYTITRKPDRADNDKQKVNKCQYPPYCQNRKEQPLHALKSSFALNKTLLRKEADLAVVIITNTDEYKSKSIKKITTEDILHEFKKQYGLEKRLMVFSLIVLPGDKICLEENLDRQFLFKEAEEGKHIADLAKNAGGGNFSICLKDYSVVARTIVQMSSQ